VQHVFAVGEERAVGAMVDGRYHEYNHGETVPGPNVIEVVAQLETPLEYIRMQLQIPDEVVVEAAAAGALRTLTDGVEAMYLLDRRIMRMPLLPFGPLHQSRVPLPMPPLPTSSAVFPPYRNSLPVPRPACLGELMKKDGKNIDAIVEARAPVRYPRHRNLNQLNPVHRGVREQFKEYLITRGITAKNSRQAWATSSEEGQSPRFVLEYSFQYFMHRLRAT
jgi:hypothetical protein